MTVGKYLLLAIVAVIFTVTIDVPQARAASEADCAIWICLPGGFPSGCGAAHSAFKKRIKKGRPPLPPLASCTTGPNGKGVNGSYQLGYEIFEACKEGYVLKESNNGMIRTGVCQKTQCSSSPYGFGGYNNRNSCDSYAAIRRAQPSYVKMWVDGDYLGQFWY